MNIFCRETQAHLALHGINNTLSSTNLGTGNLITPELWYRDCISPSSRSEELIVDDDPVTRSSSIHDDDESFNQDEDNKKESEDSVSNRLKDKNSFRIRDIANRKQNEEDIDVRVDDDEIVKSIRKNSEKEDESRRQNEQLMEQIRLQFPVENLSKFRTSISPLIRDRSKDYLNSNKDYVNSIIQDSGSSHESEGHSRETLIMKDTSQLVHKENSRGRRNIRYGITKPKKSSKSPTWSSEQSTPPLPLLVNSAPRIIHPPHTPFKFPSHPSMLPGRPMLLRPPMIPLRPQIPLNSPSTSSSLLPPVTVLVPYPIPIPIPVPIPIPLPIPMFGKLPKENGDLSSKDEKASGTSIPEDLSKRKVSTPETKASQEILEITKAPSPSTSDIKTSKIYCNEIVDAKVQPVCLTSKNSRPSRKRRRNPETSEEIEVQLKRKMSV